MNLLDATMVVVGIMIGSGIFIVSADIARTVGSAGMLLTVWVVTGVITLIGALSYGELGGLFPQAGGQYVYLREAFNPLIAFLYGWTVFMVIQTGSIAAVGVAFAKYLAVLVPSLGDDRYILSIGDSYHVSYAQVVAMLLIIFLTWVNTRGIHTGKLVQNTFTFAKIASLAGIIILGLFIGYNHETVAQNMANFWNGLTFDKPEGSVGTWIPVGGMGLLVAIAVAQVGSLFSSDGWNNITFAAGEVVNPKRTIPLALTLGTIIVTALYLLVNVVYVVTLPVIGNPDGVGAAAQGISFAASDRVGAASAEIIFPGVGATLMAVLIMISTFGCNNGMILAGARCYYAMAKDKLFFKNNGELNSRGTPANALWIQCAWACFLCLTGQYGNLLDYVIFAVLIFYIITIIGIFRLRKTMPNAERPIKAFGYPVLPIIYIAMATFICIVLLIEKPMYTYPGLGIVLLGIPVYYLWQSSTKKSA